MSLGEDVERGARDLGVTLDLGAVEGLARFTEALATHGRERGVTALRETEDILRELVLDSLAAAPHLPRGARVADLGSGGGVPGLPLALARPDLHVVLVESLGRKVSWLEEQVEALGLSSRVEVLPVRAEDLGRDPAWRGTLDVVVAKALAALPVLIEFALPLLKVGGRLYAYKGPAAAEELPSSQRALREVGGAFQAHQEYQLRDRSRVLCIVEKVRATPNRYPRRAGTPERKPL